jgi:hypothetical protein
MNFKPVQFVNVHGQPIDLKAQMTEGARQRYLLGKEAAPTRKPTVKRGYAAQPGTGPDGETCKTCAHKRSFGLDHGGKTYIKCQLREATWTNGEGTDILARSPACSKWEKKL